MGGTGSLGSTTGAKVPYPPELKNLMETLIAQAAPARKLEFQQLTEALQTGGVGARIPIIQRAVEAAMGANQQSETLGRQASARAGQAGSPFDVASQLGTRTADSARVAAIGPEYAAGLIQQGPAMVQNTTAQALSLGQMQLQNSQFNAQQTSGFYEDLKNSLQSFSPGGGSGPRAMSSGEQPTSINYAQLGQGDPATFNPSGAQFQE